ncbi:sensor histidine kinase [[Clostridium] fimetarium]|uniref:Two-component system, sensor histidine kinase YesM n=1 Tax=[Clostridium] fimetarium TaxID=99656 RepID=A0A1I0PYR8_9FIRM|nr:sensor histidine kinase [[Clostridium] fimetarium]SEW19577.1 two-component system, sensor histidine kinase YesM [[Clostridium] fimetarium]
MLKKVYRNLPFKKQLMLFLTVIGLICGIVIAIVIYFFETNQVKKNSTYLINNTTKQTATMFNSRLEIILNQYNKLGDNLSLWRLVNDRYSSENSAQKYDDIIEIYNKMDEIYSNNGEIMDSIYFENSHGTVVQIYKDMVYDKASADLGSYNLNQNPENYGYIWINNHEDSIFKTKIPRNVITIVQKLKNLKNEEIGTMILNLKSNYFEKLLNQVEISENGYAMLLSEDGYMISDVVDEKFMLTKEEQDLLLQQAQVNTVNTEIKGTNSNQNMFLYYAPLKVNNWYLVSVVPYNDLMSSSRQLAYVLTLIIIIVLVVAIIISAFLATLITRPIEKLSKQVIEFQTNPNVEFEVKSGYELTTLANGLSSLKMSVEKLLDQVRIEQEQKAKLKLLMLQAQIQPHFLYNTLASINQLINLKENSKASKMCEALSKFYRLGLSNGKDIISVKEEIEHIKNYLFIQKYRYEKDFEYSINIAENIMDMNILKLSLQPLVENAIYHGIKNKEDIGMIVISGYKAENTMILEIFDDGCGMTEDELKQIRENANSLSNEVMDSGFGIYNVSSRLKLFFGNEAQLMFDSSKGVYTQVKIIIPLDKLGE